MPQVFISYAHVEPDQRLAAQLSRFVEANGFGVFVDSNIRVGQDWVEQIDTQLRQSSYFVVLLSQASVKSDMVRREIAIAYKLRKANRLTIFPVRLALEDELPYDLSAYLDLIQHVSWRSGEPFEPICRCIVDSMQGASGSKPALRVAQQIEAADLEQVTQQLARYVGPVARVIVNRAATKVSTLSQLCDLVAGEIPTPEERTKFLSARRG